MINGILGIIGFLLVYLCWSVSLMSWSRLTELGIEHKRSSTTFFDDILGSALFGAVVARISWMISHLSTYQGVPWGILPYSRSATEFVWFTVFPWRFLRVTEGMYFPVLWVIMGILIIITVFLPTVRLARKLKLEKRGIMRGFVIRNILCAGIVALYFGVLTYFSL